MDDIHHGSPAWILLCLSLPRVVRRHMTRGYETGKKRRRRASGDMLTIAARAGLTVAQSAAPCQRQMHAFGSCSSAAYRRTECEHETRQREAPRERKTGRKNGKENDGGGDTESNRRKRLCRPSHNHSATPPRMASPWTRVACCGPQCSRRWKNVQRLSDFRRPRPSRTADSSAGRSCGSVPAGSRATRYGLPYRRGSGSGHRATHSRPPTRNT